MDKKIKTDFKNILAINASAGSGKTYQLTLRYLSLLFLGAHPSKILAVTFTKKAAKEMRERIAQTLIGLSDGKIGAGSSLYEQIDSLYDGDVQKKAKLLLEKFLSSNNKISTIDSFVHQILRKFCFYANVRHDFELFMLDEGELKQRFLEMLPDKKRFIGYLLSKNESVLKIMSLFEALYEEESDLVVIKQGFAGYDRAEFFASSKLFLDEANGFYQFLNRKKPAKYPLRFFTSPHEFLKSNSFEKLLTERETLSAHRDYKALSDDESERMFASLKALFAEYLRSGARDTIAFLLDSFDSYRSARMSINKEKNALGFDDVAKLVRELLEDGKIDSDFLYFRLDGEIDHILIDEFQDTSILQFRIIRPLLDEIVSGVGTGEFKSFFLVGDPKQSIYRFRGAAAGMFENATGYVKSKALGRYEEMYLDTNFRSSKAPVTFVNESFAAQYKDVFKTQKSASSDDGFAEVETVNGDDILSATLNKVNSFLEGGAKADDITILAYTNDDVEEIASFLETNGVKTQKESSKTLHSDEGVAAVMSFLEYAALKRLGRDCRLAKLEFLALTKSGEDEFDELFAQLSSVYSPSKMAFCVVDFFALASPNTVKLIEIAATHDDLFGFLTSKAVQSQQKISIRSGGVNLMTVHKSKGLEFAYCIVCDTLKKRDGKGTPPILERHKNFKLTELVVTSKSAKIMLSNVREAMEEEERMSKIDLLNANYVAMTRAKYGLCVIQKGEGYSKLEALGLDAKSANKKEFKKSGENKPDKKSYHGVKLSAKLEAQDEYIKEGTFAPSDYGAINFGLAMHGYFESINGLQDGEKAKIYVQNKYGMALGDSLLSALDLARSFDATKLLSGSKTPQIHKEISVCKEEDGELKLYRIDLLLVFEDRAVIVDFKSSFEAKEGYKKQLNTYRNIVEEILGLKSLAYLALNRGGRLLLVGMD